MCRKQMLMQKIKIGKKQYNLKSKKYLKEAACLGALC
jgi:hypothetical protein